MTTTILALDLGTTTGWALRGSDGHITSGSESFRPQRFEGGGMRFLRFKRWLTELKAVADGIDALRDAIGRSGLSLNEISQRLREQAAPVSVSALSYWQNGENRPERASSLAAVSALESILGQEEGTLTALLGPRRPRGRWTNRPGLAVAYDQVWAHPENVARALAKVDAGPADLDTPHRLSQYVSYRVNAQGCEESMRVRRLIRADHDGTSRFVFVTRCSALPQPPVVTFTEGCQMARFRADVPSSTCVFEFLLDRPLGSSDRVDDPGRASFAADDERGIGGEKGIPPQARAARRAIEEQEVGKSLQTVAGSGRVERRREFFNQGHHVSTAASA